MRMYGSHHPTFNRGGEMAIRSARRGLAASCVAAALVASTAACGSDDSDDASGAASSSQAAAASGVVEQAKENVERYVAVDKIGPTEPVGKPIPKDKDDRLCQLRGSRRAPT
jgi:hypothetical protein